MATVRGDPLLAGIQPTATKAELRPLQELFIDARGLEVVTAEASHAHALQTQRSHSASSHPVDAAGDGAVDRVPLHDLPGRTVRLAALVIRPRILAATDQLLSVPAGGQLFCAASIGDNKNRNV